MDSLKTSVSCRAPPIAPGPPAVSACLVENLAENLGQTDVWKDLAIYICIYYVSVFVWDIYISGTTQQPLASSRRLCVGTCRNSPASSSAMRATFAAVGVALTGFGWFSSNHFIQIWPSSASSLQRLSE